MGFARSQDIILTHKNQSHFYILIIKPKLQIQHHLQLLKKKKKNLHINLKKWARSVYYKLQNSDAQNQRRPKEVET